MIKKFIKKITPYFLIQKYHKTKSLLANKIYNNPSKDIFVIGITGTKGKSTTANFIWSVLQNNNIKTGIVGTANIRIGEKEYKNTSHMTMPSPFELQKWMAKMKKENCKVIILEVTSEGIKQYRNLNISFSAGIFTNLTPEHLPSHNNSFTEYKHEKKKFFQQLENENAELILVNADNKYSDEFYNYNIKNKIKISLNNYGDLNAKISTIKSTSTKFVIENEEYNIGIGGDKNVENALFAVAVGKYFNLNSENIKKGLNKIHSIPGRMEKIDIGQNFSVFVDYAHEEQSIKFLMRMGEEIIKKQNSGRIIILIGAEGGGRDKGKRKIMGEIVGEKANIVVVSNVDPYEDDPKEICEDIAVHCENKNKTRNKDLFVIEDRRNGINKALSVAKRNDIVFVTGKGSEQSITIDGKKRFWDDRLVVKEELRKIWDNDKS